MKSFVIDAVRAVRVIASPSEEGASTAVQNPCLLTNFSFVILYFLLQQRSGKEFAMAHRKTKRGKKTAWRLDEKSWDRIKDIFPVKEIGPLGGRPPVAHRRVFEALIWFCRSGCPWEYMPKNFPSWST
jgi:hypothetical protein